MKKSILIILLILLVFPLSSCSEKYDKYLYIDSNNQMLMKRHFFNSGIVLTDYKGNKKEVIVPSEIDGNKVVGITTDFINSLISKKVQSLKISDTVERIITTDYFYSPDKYIEKVYPDGNVPFIEEENGITYIDGWVYTIDYKKCKNVILREDTRGIRDNFNAGERYEDFPPIENVYIPGTIKMIPTGAIEIPSKNFIIGYGVEYIENRAIAVYSENNEYAAINLPSSVMCKEINAIGHYADVFETIKSSHIVFIIGTKIEEVIKNSCETISLDDITIIEHDRIEGIYYDKEFTQKYNNEEVKYNTVFYVKTKE